MFCLDIAMNSIRAKAKYIVIELGMDTIQDRLTLFISDDGCGMSEEVLQRVSDPFYTTRNTRKVGLGVAFFKGLATMCEGQFTLESKVNEGTRIGIDIQRSHLDTPPIGNLAETMITLIQADESIEWTLIVRLDEKEFKLETLQIKEMLDGVSLVEPSILIWIKEYIQEQLAGL